MDPGDRQPPVAGMMYSPTANTPGAWFSPPPGLCLEEFYKQYQHQQQAGIVAACPSPGLVSMASPVGWPSTPSLHGAPTYIASPGSPLPPSFSFLTAAGLNNNRLFPRQQAQPVQHHLYRSAATDAQVQCCLSSQSSLWNQCNITDASTQTVDYAQLWCSNCACQLQPSEDYEYQQQQQQQPQDSLEDDGYLGDQYTDEEVDIETEDSKDCLYLSSASNNNNNNNSSASANVNLASSNSTIFAIDSEQSEQDRQLQFQSLLGQQQSRRQIGVVRARLRSEERDSAASASSSMEAATSSTSAIVVEAKSASRGQRQWDILCAVAGLLQQVDLLQLDEDQQQCLEAADIAVNYVDNLGCRYDTKPVSRVDLSAGSKLIPDAKDCEQLVAQIEALWRRIQQSRSLLKSSSRGRHSHASRSRHRSDAVVAASASAGSSGSDGGDAFSPFASSVHMLAFCASEQKQQRVSQKTIHQSADAEAEVHGCPTIDRMATKSKSKLASSASTAYERSTSVGAYVPATASTSAASASATSPNRTTCSTASNSSSNKKRRYNSSGSESKRQRKKQFLQQQQQQEQQEQQQQDAGPPTPELRSCQLAENDLRDGQRLLVSQADAVDGGATAGGLWYSGVLKEVQPPDVYRVSLNGSPRSRHQYFTREELLCQAVLEIRPSSTAELPAGCRVCAYWSASLTALYPGTVSSHQCHDDSEADNEAEEVDNDEEQPEAGRQLVYIEFDDNDSRWIPLDRIRMLPPGPPPQPATCRRSPAAAPACGGSPAARRRRRSSATSAASTAAPAPPVATFEWADAGKRRGRRQRHRSLLRNGQPINVGDAVMFKSSAIDRPFYGRVTDMWEEEAGLDDDDVEDDVEDRNVGAGSDRRRMWVEAAWFYQPVEMPESLGRRFRRDQGRALFLSGHRDRNEARTILRKLPLLSFAKSVRKSSSATKRPDTYFLAGEYDASSKRIIRLDPEYEAALLAREAERRQRKQQKKRLLAESSSSSSRR